MTFETIPWSLLLVGAIVAVFFLSVVVFLKQFKRCPSNRILVIFGKVGGTNTSRCIHGGGAFVVPVLQDCDFLSLEPRTIDLELTGALSKKNIRVNVPSTFTVGISTRPEIMQNAAERLLGLSDEQISTQARDIILGQLRLVLATLSIEEINQDRDRFKALVNDNVEAELNKIGLEVINVNIRDITDESGYIDAIGKKAAAEAINQAKIEVAEQEKLGAIGEATAVREREVMVAKEKSQSAVGQTEAQRDQRMATAKLEAEGAAAEAASKREKEVAISQQQALTDQGKKEAERTTRIALASFEAEAVKGEAQAQASILDTSASLAKQQAEAKRVGEVSLANAQREIFEAQKAQELAFLEKTEVARKEVERRKTEIEAEAEAAKSRLLAKGEADAVALRYAAEAEGIEKVLRAKAKGYESLMQVCGDQKHLVPTLLMIEKLPEIVAEQVKAIQNLKIDKITVWDGGREGEASTTSSFLRSLVGSLPPIHELANQAGIELPAVLGSVRDTSEKRGGHSGT